MIVYCHIGEYDTYSKVMEVDIKMNKLIFVLLLLLFSQSTFANWVSLTCVESGGNFTMTIEFNEKEELVRIMEKRIVKAIITKNEIVWNIILNNIDYIQTLNRTNGILLVRIKEKNEDLTPYQCQLSNPKF